MKKALLLLVLIAPSCLWAQVSLTTTTLSQAVNGSLPNGSTVGSVQTYVYLTSLAGVNAGLNSIRTVLYVDREMMAVDTVNTGTNQVTVLRSYNGTLQSPHASGATVYVGSPDQFQPFDPAGACNAPLTKVTPWINYLNANQWICTSGVWALSGGPIFASGFQFVSSAPSGACTNGATPQLVISTGIIYSCQASVWGAVGVASFPVNSPQTVNASGAVTPSGSGQITATGDLQTFSGMGGVASPQIPTLTVSNTGGNLSNSQTIFVMLTACINATCTQASNGSTKPSPEAAIGTGSSCTGGNQCSVTVTMPSSCTSPVAPQTGCAVWSTSASGSGNELQQTTASACVNITSATCVIQSVGAGAVLPTSNTTSQLPSPICTSSLPSKTMQHISETPFMWGYNPIQGCYEDLMALEYNNTPLTTQANNKLDQLAISIFRPMHLDNVGGVQPLLTYFPDFINCLFCIAVDSGSNLASGLSTNQESAWGWVITNSNNSTPTYDQYGGVYGEAHVGAPGKTANSFSCNPASSESCVYGVRSIVQNNNTSGTFGGGIGMDGVAGVCFWNGSGTATTNTGCHGVYGMAQNDTAYNGNGLVMVGIRGQATDVTGGSSSMKGVAVYSSSPGTRFPGTSFNNIGVEIDPQSSGSHFGADFGIWELASVAGDSLNYFGGPAAFAQGIQGSILPTSIQTPTGNAGVIVNCNTTCTASYTYKLVVKDAAGGFAPATGALNCTSAATTLSNAANSCNPNMNASGYTPYSGETNYGMYSVDVYRTASTGTPSTTGYIGTMNCFLPGGCSFADTGIAVSIPPNDDPATPPAYDTSGRIAGNSIGTLQNCAAVGTAASPSVASCSNAPAGLVSCATNASGATCQVNTTRVTGSSEIIVHQRLDTTAGTRLATTCNATQDSNSTAPPITAVSPGVSFTFKVGTIATNPECFSYLIVN